MPDPAQRVLGVLLSAITLPLVIVLVALIRIDGSGPGIHRAVRVGRNGAPFTCFKLRTMRLSSDPGPGVTRARDPRISRVGWIIRRYRLDEVPQLWNVARGDMRLVGPRPEAPAYVQFDDPMHRRVFTAAPGITGLTQLIYLDEASMLDGPDPETTYRTSVLPAKLLIDAAYLDRRDLALDLWILARTVRAVLGRSLDIATAEARLGCSLRDQGSDGAGYPAGSAS